MSRVESDDESCDSGRQNRVNDCDNSIGSEWESVLGEIDDAEEIVSGQSNKIKVHGKKKEPPGYCEACFKQLSQKSDVSRHWRLLCPKNTKRKQSKTKGETD